MIRLAGACVVLALVCGSASAQAPAANFPTDRLALHDVAVTPPAHWQTARTIVQGILIQSIDLVPDGESLLQWRNKMNVITLPAGMTRVDAVAIATDKSQNCAASLTLNLRPRNAGSSELWEEVLCSEGSLDPDGNPAAPIEVNVYRSVQIGDAMYIFQRSWRGPGSEIPQFFARHSVARAAALPAAPASADFEAYRAAMPRVVEDFAAELASAFQPCDLSGAACAPLHQPAAGAPADALVTISVRGSGQGAPANQHLPVASSDFNNVATAQAIAHAIATAQSAGGGVISFSGAADANTSRVRAFALRLGRIVQNNGVPPDALSFDLWAH